MPSQLITNSAIYFMCARNFTFNGVQYEMGDRFPQEETNGKIEVLVRTRRVVAVVDDSSDKPRHWHHHVWLRSEISKKLGLLHREDSDALTGSSLLNRRKQMEIKDASDSTSPEVRDESQELWQAQDEGIRTEAVLAEENDEVAEEPEETETPDRVEPGEGNDLDEDERVIEESDLYDPTEHNVDEVLDYLTGDITDKERERVLAVERSNKARKGILDA